MICQSWRTKSFTAHTIRFNSPSLPLDAKLSFTNLLPTEDHGAAVVQIDGILVFFLPNTNVAITLCPRLGAYCISGLAKLFLQHSQVLCLTWTEHHKGLSDEMVTTLKGMTLEKQKCVLTLIISKHASHSISAPQALVYTYLG
jgi:hypothetical protein